MGKAKTTAETATTEDAGAAADTTVIDPPVNERAKSDPPVQEHPEAHTVHVDQQDGDGTHPYPDVDQPPQPESLHRWDESATVMVEEIRRHVKQSHGMEPDKQLLREIADYIESKMAK